MEFLNRLSEKCELTVLFERHVASDRDEKWKSREKYKFNAIFLKGLPYGTDASMSFGVINYIKNEKYDAIVIAAYHTITAMLAMQYMRQNRIPFILSSDGGFVKNENKIKYLLKRHFISMATLWLSPGGKTDSYLEHYGAKKNFICRYSFTSVSKEDLEKKRLAKFDKIKFLEDCTFKIGNEKVILTVGQMIHRKGIDVLLKAVGHLTTPVTTIIIGGKPTEEYLRLIEEYKIKQVYFIDFLSAEQLFNYFELADLFVLPTREDIWGLVVIEALSHNLPIITTFNCNAGIELAKSGLAHLVQSDNVMELTEAIEEELSSNKIRRLPDECYKFTYENEVEEHIRAFSKFLNLI